MSGKILKLQYRLCLVDASFTLASIFLLLFCLSSGFWGIFLKVRNGCGAFVLEALCVLNFDGRSNTSRFFCSPCLPYWFCLGLQWGTLHILPLKNAYLFKAQPSSVEQCRTLEVLASGKWLTTGRGQWKTSPKARSIVLWTITMETPAKERGKGY